MLLNIRGHTEKPSESYVLLSGSRGTRLLNEVDITSHVYSKEQARAEFERFLSATDLPDQTNKEGDRK